jgi:hypothetical protein
MAAFPHVSSISLNMHYILGPKTITESGIALLSNILISHLIKYVTISTACAILYSGSYHISITGTKVYPKVSRLSDNEITTINTLFEKQHKGILWQNSLY